MNPVAPFEPISPPWTSFGPKYPPGHPTKTSWTYDKSPYVLHMSPIFPYMPHMATIFHLWTQWATPNGHSSLFGPPFLPPQL